MTDPDYNLPTPPAIRALAAMLLAAALWVAVFMAVLLLTAPARAETLLPPPSKVHVYEVPPAQADEVVKSGDKMVVVDFTVKLLARANEHRIEINAPGWNFLGAYDPDMPDESRGGAYTNNDDDKLITWFDLPPGSVRRLRMCLHGGPDIDGLVKAAKAGKAVKLWQR